MYDTSKNNYDLWHLSEVCVGSGANGSAYTLST